MAQQLLFDLAGADVEAAGDDDLFLAVDDGRETVGVHGDDVTGAQPAVDQGLGGLLGISPVALEDLRALDQQFTRLADPHLFLGVVDVHHLHQGGREGHPDGAGSPAGEEGVAESHRGGLGEAVALHQQAAGDRLPQFAGFLDQRHRTRDAPSCRRQRDPLCHGLLGCPLIQRGHRAVDRRRSLLRCRHDQVDIRPREQHLPRLLEHPEGGVHGDAEGMEQRQCGVAGLATRLGTQHPRLALPGVGVQVEVAEHGALGTPGGARGVLNRGQVVHGGTRVPAADRPGRNQLLPADGALGAAGQRFLLGPQAGQRQPQRQLQVPRERVEQVDRHDLGRPLVDRQLVELVDAGVQGDRDAGAVVCEELLKFGGGVQRVVFHDYGAQADDRIERDQVLRAVRQQDRHPVTGMDAEPAQPLRGAGHPVAQFPVGHLGTEELGRDMVAAFTHSGVEQ